MSHATRKTGRKSGGSIANFAAFAGNLQEATLPSKGRFRTGGKTSLKAATTIFGESVGILDRKTYVILNEKREIANKRHFMFKSPSDRHVILVQ